MAAGFAVRRADHPHRLVDRRLIAKAAPNVGNVVVDSLRNPNHCQRVSSRHRFQVQLMGSPQSTIATHAEQNVDSMFLQIINRNPGIYRPPGSTEDRAAVELNVLHHLGIDMQRLKPIRGIEPRVPKPDSENVATAVAEVHLQKNGTDYIIDARAQASASHDSSFGFTRTEIQLLPRSRALKIDGFTFVASTGQRDGLLHITT